MTNLARIPIRLGALAVLAAALLWIGSFGAPAAAQSGRSDTADHEAVAAFASWMEEARHVVDSLAALLRDTDTIDRIAIDVAAGRTDPQNAEAQTDPIIYSLKREHSNLTVAAIALDEDAPDSRLGETIARSERLRAARGNLSAYARDFADRVGVIIADSIAGLRAAVAGMPGVVRDVTARSLQHFGTLITAETEMQRANLALISERHPNHHLVRSFISTNEGINVALDSLNLTLASGRARDPGRAMALAAEHIQASREALDQAEAALAGYQLNLLQRAPRDEEEAKTLAQVRALFNNIGAGLAVERLVVADAEALIDTVLKQAAGDTEADGDAALAELQARINDRGDLLRQRISLIKGLGNR